MISIDIEKGLKDFILDVSLKIKPGQFVSIFGKSGSGKTTILRTIAGLARPDKGSIKVGNDIWYDSKRKINLPPQKRDVSLVFQGTALFPNMTVLDNIKYGMKEPNQRLIDEVVAITKIGDILKRKPINLSGGEKQRVELARAVLKMPKILLLDEPFSALDIHSKLEIYEELVELHNRFNLTTILISHDIFEVGKLAEKVFLIDKGKILKEGKPEEIFKDKRYKRAFDFYKNLLGGLSDGKTQ